MCIRWGTELLWWEKMLLSFIITFVISIVINMNKDKVNNDNKVNMDKETNEMSFKNGMDNPKVNMNKEEMKDIKNNKYTKNIKNKIDNFMGMNIIK